MTRYHGVFAARAKARSEVVPGPVPVEPEPVQPEPVQLQLALVKIANTPDEVARVLAELGLGPRPPPRPRPTLPGQLELEFAA